MQKVLLSIAAAASTLAIATPAAAQYYPQPQGPAYGYDYNHRDREVRVFMQRINEFQRDLRQFDREDRLSRGDAARIHNQLEEVRHRLMQASYNGLSRRERVEFDNRLDRLRANMRNEMRQYRGDRRHDRDDRRDRHDRNWRR